MNLQKFALDLARGSLCEVQLSIFLNKCKLLESKEEIKELYKNTRNGSKDAKKHEKLLQVQQDPNYNP